MSRLSLKSVNATLAGQIVLDDVSVAVEPGALVALVGPNGAGKSSLLRASLGLLPVDTGQIMVAGDVLAELSNLERAQRMAYLAQDRAMAWAMPVIEMVALGRFASGGRGAYETLTATDQTLIDEALRKTGLEELAHRSVHALSGGEQARVHLARVLAASASMILADEPFAALDPRWQLEGLATLKNETERGASVLIALHDLQLAERFADTIMVLHHGKLAASGPAKTVLTSDVLADVFGVRRHPDGGFDPA